MRRDRELPWQPPKRQADIVSQFSECLLFVTNEANYTTSHWVIDPKLDRDISKLIKQHPQNTATDWLVYFVARVTSNQYSQTDRKLALQHLWCFYQLDFYYLARSWWFKTKCPQGVYSWTELFEAIYQPFFDLKEAENALKYFDPKNTKYSYINTICYRAGRDWLRQRLGRDFEANPIALQSREQSQVNDDEIFLSQQLKIEAAETEEQESSQEHAKIKSEQERIWNVVCQNLADLKRQSQQGQLSIFEPSQLTLWEIMLIGYGLNVGQSGTSQILDHNNKKVDQSKISRKLKALKIELFASCINEFSAEIAENFSDQNLVSELQPSFQKMAKEQNKTLDSILKTYYRDWLYNVLLKAQNARRYSLLAKDGIIECLKLWFKEQLHLTFDIAYLTNGMVKKLYKVIALWIEQLNHETR
ncbi:MAG: hypothetical protein F6J87_07425 [Spirulina sp. SIO3F2]|nr:hypothetical protein [Spirulina sp. SIO3F2]